MMKFIKDIMTEVDGESWDAGRVLLIAGVVCFLGLACYDVILLKHQFEGVGYGTGFGGLLGGGMTGIGFRGKMEK